MRVVLITGAEGFMGTALVHYLRQHGYNVVAAVRNRARKLACEQNFIRALVCDVSDPINVARVVASVKPDAIIHLAGMTQPAQADRDPLACYQSIVTAWANLLDAARRSVPRARLLMVSAADVYGKAANDHQPVGEDHTPEPMTTFGSMKLLAEQVAHTYHRNFALDVTIARPFHHAGPQQGAFYYFSAIAERLAGWDYTRDGKVLELPDLDCERELLHVHDVAEAYEALLTNSKPNRVYNVSRNESYSCRGLVEKMIKVAGLEVELKPIGDSSSPNTRQIKVLRGANARICDETGWQASRSVDQALTDLVHYYQSRVAGSVGAR